MTLVQKGQICILLFALFMVILQSLCYAAPLPKYTIIDLGTLNP